MVQGGPWQTWNSAEASSKRLQGAEKVASPVTKFLSTFLQAPGLLGLVNSQQLWAGFKQTGLAPQTQSEYWERAGPAAGWGSGTDHVWYRHSLQF